MKTLIVTLAFVLAFFASAVLATVNINTASQKELSTLDGVGQVKAQAIIDYRKAHDGFDSPKEIKKVDGIGDKTFENIRDDITVRGEDSE